MSKNDLTSLPASSEAPPDPKSTLPMEVVGPPEATHKEAPVSCFTNITTSDGTTLGLTIRGSSPTQDELIRCTVALMNAKNFIEEEYGLQERRAVPASSTTSSPSPFPQQSSDSATTSDDLTFPAKELVVTGYTDDGRPMWKIKGGIFHKWGIPVYPEVLAEIGVVMDDLDDKVSYNLTGYTAHYLEKPTKKVKQLVKNE